MNINVKEFYSRNSLNDNYKDEFEMLKNLALDPQKNRMITSENLGAIDHLEKYFFSLSGGMTLLCESRAVRKGLWSWIRFVIIVLLQS